MRKLVLHSRVARSTYAHTSCHMSDQRTPLERSLATFALSCQRFPVNAGSWHCVHPSGSPRHLPHPSNTECGATFAAAGRFIGGALGLAAAEPVQPPSVAAAGRFTTLAAKVSKRLTTSSSWSSSAAAASDDTTATGGAAATAATGPDEAATAGATATARVVGGEDAEAGDATSGDWGGGISTSCSGDTP